LQKEAGLPTFKGGFCYHSRLPNPLPAETYPIALDARDAELPF